MKTLKKVVGLYKIPLLVSLTLFVVFMALTVLRDPVDIISAFLGIFLGTFVLDLDYFIYAYVTDPDKDFSKTLKGYFDHRDFSNAVSYIYYHREDIKEKTLQSVLFQVVAGTLTFFSVLTPLNYFAKTLILSAYVNSLYRLAEQHFADKELDWFWVLKERPSKKGVRIYLIINILVLLITLQLLR